MFKVGQFMHRSSILSKHNCSMIRKKVKKIRNSSTNTRENEFKIKLANEKALSLQFLFFQLIVI